MQEMFALKEVSLGSESLKSTSTCGGTTRKEKMIKRIMKFEGGKVPGHSRWTLQAEVSDARKRNSKRSKEYFHVSNFTTQRGICHFMAQCTTDASREDWQYKCGEGM